MKTYILIEVEHVKDVPNLADKIAQRAYTIDGVRDASGHVQSAEVQELVRAGFSLAEISLGAQPPEGS